MAVSSFFPLKCRVKRHSTGSKIIGTHISARFGRAMDAVHAAVFPFHRKRAAIADVVQRDDDVLEVDVAVAERTKIPIAPAIGEIRVAAEHADRAVAVTPPHVLHVRVKNAVAELADEFHIVHALIAEMRRIVIKAKAPMIFHRFQRALRRGDVERDFGRMHFEREVDVVLFEHVKDRQQAFGEIGEALFG